MMGETMPKPTKSGWEKAGQVAKDMGLGALNYVGGLTGVFGNTYQNTTINQLSPAENARRVKDYRTSLGFNADQLPSHDGFDTFVGARIQSAAGFGKVSVAGTTLSDAFKTAGTNATALQLQRGIDQAMALTPATTQAQQDFAAGMKAVNDAVKDTKSNFHPRNMVSFLQELKSNAAAAITAQHAAEKKALDDLFGNQQFRQDLGGIAQCTPAECETLRLNMQATLKESQTKELAEFNKSVDIPAKMHDAAKIEHRRVSTFARLYEQSERMRKEIDELYKKNQQNGSADINIFQGQHGSAAMFKGLKLTDLPFIESVTGIKIKPRPMGKDKDGNELCSFSMQLPNRILRADYYYSSHNKVKADLLCLVGAVRAAGYDSVTLRIDLDKDPEHAMEVARAAYEAALEEGFDGKKITMVVNGQKKTADELFADCPSRRQAAERQAALNAAADKEAEEDITNDVYYDRFKKNLMAGRLADAAAQSETESADDVGNRPMTGQT